MSVGPRPMNEDVGGQTGHRTDEVVAFESRPGRFVFVEEGNCDGWIATDCTVVPSE